MALNFNTQTALVTVYAWGAGGGGGTIGGWTYGARGGGGGFASGKMIVKAGELYQIVVGGGGIVNMGGVVGNGYTAFVEGGGAGPIGTQLNDNRYASSGGGYSGVFLNVASTQTTALIIAGGGGGGGASRAGTYNGGGAGGGLCGQKGLAPYDWTTYFGVGGGNGGTQSAGGAPTTAMSIQGGAGSALFGGRPVTNSLGGGGGGGWFGGGAGGYVESNTMGGGGGGSGFINSSTIYCGVLITGCYSTPACSSNAYRGLAGNGGRVAQGGEFGRIVIAYPGAQQAHGGTVSTSSGTTIHTFDRSGVFALYGTPIYGSTATQVEMLIVGGGGGGGANMGGGGGGGAVVSVNSTLTVGSYLVTVGQGGRGFCGTCAQRGGQGGHSGVVRNYQNSYSYHFDGIADYIYTTSTVSPIQQYSILGSSNALLDQNFTFEGYYWFMDGSTQRSSNLLLNYSGIPFGSGHVYFGKHALYDGKITFWAGNYSPSFPLLIDPIHPPTGKWVHYAISRNGANFTLFRDGVSVAANTTVTNITPPMVASLFLGNTASSFANNHRGYMSNVRLTTGNSVYTTGVNTATTSKLYYSGVFNGITDYLSTASTTLLTVGANPYTLEAWINLPRLPQTQGDAGRYIIAQKGGTVTSNFEWQFGVHQSTSTTSTYTLTLLQSTGGTAATLSTATSTIIPITSGTWNHVALSITGGTTSFWFNGQPVGTATAPTFYSGTGPLTIGASNNGTQQLQGYISNLRLLNGTALYSSAFIPSTSPLTSVTNTVLLTLQNSTIVDNAQTASTFISFGTPGIWTNSPFSTATQVFTVPTDQLGRVQSSSTNLLGTSINAIMDRTQNPAGSLVFNGTTDYIAFPPNSIYSPAGSFTIEAYVYLQATAYGTPYYIASNWNNGVATSCSWKVGVNASGFIIFSYGIGASNVTITGTTRLVPLNRWAHVAVVRDTSNNVILYVNGIADATVTAVSGTLNLNTTIAVKIGSDDSATHVIFQPWFGLISGFRFVAGEAVWTTGFTPPQRLPGLSTTSANTVLLLNFPYNILGSDTDVYLRSFSDSSNYQRQPTITGTPYPMHWSPYINTGSVSLLTAQSPLVPVDYSYQGINMVRGAANNNVTATTFSPFYPELTVTPKTPNTIFYSTLFNGSTDYLTVPATASGPLDLATGAPNWTVDCWIYCTNTSIGGSIFWAGGGSGLNPSYALWIQSDGTPQWIVGNGGGGGTANNATPIAANTWYHFALVRNNTTLTLYVNGVAGTPVTMGFTMGATSTPTLWVGAASDGRPFAGYISNLRVVKGQAIYTANFNRPTTPPAVSNNTSLLTVKSASTKDFSINNLAITTYGSPSNVLASPPFDILNYSAFFDGYSNSSNVLVTATNLVTQSLSLPLDFTIECWINTSGALDNNSYILNKGGGTAISPSSYSISIGWPNVYFQAATNTAGYIIGGDAPTQSGFMGAIQANTWNHIAVTRQGGTFRGFVNGVQGMTSSTTATSTLIDTSVRGLAIGSNYATNWGVPANIASVYSGYISNLRIIRGQALYTGNFTPPVQALTTATVGTAGANVTATITGTVVLLALQSPSIADNSGFGYTLGVTGQVFPQTYNPFSSVTSLGPTSALAMGSGGGASNYSVKTFGASMGANGGGASGNSAVGAGGAGAPGVMGIYGGGFAGAVSTGSGLYWMGGGGGAGGPGFSGGIFTTGAKGGVGVPSTILGNTYYFGGGGGGSGYTLRAGCGGRGGGGGGAPKSTQSGGYGDRSSIFRAQDGGYGTLVAVTNQPGGFAAPNSGGGGGGGSHQTTFGGAGGSGVVVIKYPGPQRAMGGVVTTVGTSTVHTFYKTDVFTMLGNMTYPTALGGVGSNGYAGGGQGANSFGAYGGPGAPGGALNTASNVYFGGVGAGGGSWCTYFAGGGGGTGVCGLVNLFAAGGAPNQSGGAGNGGSTSTQFGNGGLFGAGGGGSATVYYNQCWGNGASGAVLITYNTTATSNAFPNPTPAAYSYLNKISYPYGQGAGVSSSTFLTFSTVTDRNANYAFGAVINNSPAKTYYKLSTGRTTPFVGACVPVSRYPQASCIYAGNTQVTTYVTAHCMMMKNNDVAQPVYASGATVGNPGNYQVIQEVTKANDPRLVTARVQNFIVGVTGVGCGTATGVVTTVNQFWTS
jgi:hypothetical protein